MKVTATLAAATLVALTALPAQAHNDTEIDTWHIGWVDRMATALEENSPTGALEAERIDMTHRHPCQILWCPSPTGTTGEAAVRPVAAPQPAEAWRPLIALYFPAEAVEAALRVLWCESRGDPNAWNPSSAAGLFQFLRSTWNNTAGILGFGVYDTGAVYDPTLNVAAAAWLSKGGTDWSQWVCKP